MVHRQPSRRLRIAAAPRAIRSTQPAHWLLAVVFALGVSAAGGTLMAQDLNALINDQPSAQAPSQTQPSAGQSQSSQGQSSQPASQRPPAPSAGSDTASSAPSSTGAPQSEQESFTPANRCPRCALYSAVQMAEQGNSCQDVIFQGAASYSVTGDFEHSDMLEVDGKTSCRISFFNDSPDRSIVIKLDRALRDMILAPSPDLYSGYLLAPRSSIDLILRPGEVRRSVEANNIVTWQDATQVGDADDSLFKIRISAN